MYLYIVIIIEFEDFQLLSLSDTFIFMCKGNKYFCSSIICENVIYHVRYLNIIKQNKNIPS